MWYSKLYGWHRRLYFVADVNILDVSILENEGQKMYDKNFIELKDTIVRYILLLDSEEGKCNQYTVSVMYVVYYSLLHNNLCTI